MISAKAASVLGTIDKGNPDDIIDTEINSCIEVSAVGTLPVALVGITDVDKVLIIGAVGSKYNI